MSEREYVVTLHKHEDLDLFYDDMETPGGNLFIPDRAVSVFNRRPVSRNTHYLLTDQEAETIRQDPRVKAVELSLEESGIKIVPMWTDTSSFWNKSNSVSSNHENWGLLRCIEGVQRVNWGSDAVNNVSGTVRINASGKNVDVVVVDGHFNPAHPEFAVNQNGTGGSRVNQFNWFSLNLQVTGGSPGTYVYTPYVDPTYPDNDGDGYPDRTIDNDHGTHVAGTVVGSSYGWARDANIYNISPYASNPSYVSNFLDYVKVWHQNKEVNPVTGIKNPTITNHSYGAVRKIDITTISSVRYQGSVISGPFDSAQLLNYGIYNTGGFAYCYVRNTGIETDFAELIAAGVIVVGSAGNGYAKIDNFSATVSADYNNYVVDPFYGTTHYNRGTITAADDIICVGAIGANADDSKLAMSMCGPRIDVYAPGRFIMSAVNSTITIYSNDPRNASYYVTKKTGTSMASPQVAGALACLAESWPTMKQTQAREYIQKTAKTAQITATNSGPTDYTDLQGSQNRYLFFVKERPDSGNLNPRLNFGNRPASGLLFPRPRVFRYGR